MEAGGQDRLEAAEEARNTVVAPLKVMEVEAAVVVPAVVAVAVPTAAVAAIGRSVTRHTDKAIFQATTGKRPQSPCRFFLHYTQL
jgi:predicted dinucleotide-binding enzyme